VGYVILFVVTAIALIPLAKLIGDATEHLSTHYGSTLGSLINVTFGNAAEHSSAIVLARKGKMDLSIGIGAGFGTQMALFVVPILVLVGIVLGQSFTLEFTIYELVTLFLAAVIMNLIAFDGKTNWFEGVILTSVCIIIAIGFFFIG